MEHKELILEAMNALIKHDNAVTLNYYLGAALRCASGLPIKLTGEAAVVNVLFQLAQQDRDTFLSIMEMVNSKRVSRGLEPLRPVFEGEQEEVEADEPNALSMAAEETLKRFDKTAYQRLFMDESRARKRRAINIENSVRPERDRLIGHARMEFMRMCGVRWKQQRDALVKAARQGSGGTLTKAEMQAILSRFWTAVDTALDEKEAAARQRRVMGN